MYDGSIDCWYPLRLAAVSSVTNGLDVETDTSNGLREGRDWEGWRAGVEGEGVANRRLWVFLEVLETGRWGDSGGEDGMSDETVFSRLLGDGARVCWIKRSSEGRERMASGVDE